MSVNIISSNQTAKYIEHQDQPVTTAQAQQNKAK
jgi:hypothetical protein